MITTKKCLGIISYLPNELELRQIRINRLIKSFKKMDELFHLPFIVVAQNYKDEDLNLINKYDVKIIRVEKGIGVGHAREVLRKYFLEHTDYDVIITLDDDAELVGDSPDEYFRQIDIHPNQVGSMDRCLHKLMSIPRSIYEKYAYDLVYTSEDLMGFEDVIFFWTVFGRDGKQVFKFHNTGIKDNSNSEGTDECSLWARGVSKEKIAEMYRNSLEQVSKITGIKIRSKK